MNVTPQYPPVPPQARETVALQSPLMIWTRRLLACNPFYLVSAACLLYGLYRLALDSAFREGSISQSATIFGSLQLYEVLLVVRPASLAGVDQPFEEALVLAGDRGRTQLVAIADNGDLDRGQRGSSLVH